MPEITPGRPGLDRLQRWMLAVVTHPEGVEAGWAAAVAGGLLPEGVRELREVVPGNARLTPTEQLHVYGYAYFARLADILAEEYPGVETLLGEADFEDACRHFLHAHPSASYTLGKLSRPFAGWLRSEGERLDIPRLRFAAAVAEVERAMEDVWDAPYQDPITADELASVPPSGWADLRMDLIAACRLLALDHPIGEFMEAVREEREWERPEPAPAWVVVYRQGSRRFRVPIAREQHDLLAAIGGGATLGGALEAAAMADGADVALMMSSVGAWLRDFASWGLFTPGEGSS